MTKLISVTIPCYNSAATLPLALASLLAQTYQNWECILVDDDSTDTPNKIIEQVNDPRIRYIRLAQNMGQGAARQKALDHCRGDYLSMLDADDWIYPNKLEKQLTIMERSPLLTLISSGMAIVNRNNELVGVRVPGLESAASDQVNSMNNLIQPPVAFAPSMIRMDVAKQCCFDPRFQRSEDADFLLQVMLGRYYHVSPEITYVYTEHASATPAKILGGYYHRMKMFWKYRYRFPVASLKQISQSAAKLLLYRVAFSIGFGSRLIERRSTPPTVQEIEAYNQARHTVLAVMDHYFEATQGTFH